MVSSMHLCFHCASKRPSYWFLSSSSSSYKQWIYLLFIIIILLLLLCAAIIVRSDRRETTQRLFYCLLHPNFDFTSRPTYPTPRASRLRFSQRRKGGMVFCLSSFPLEHLLRSLKYQFTIWTCLWRTPATSTGTLLSWTVPVVHLPTQYPAVSYSRLLDWLLLQEVADIQNIVSQTDSQSESGREEEVGE